MVKKKKIIIVILAAIAVIALLVSFVVWKSNKTDDSLGTAYVTAVSECNTAAAFSMSGNRFAGVVEAQKSEEIKVDSEKTVKEVLVSDGDKVEVGDELFTYDVEAMQLELEEGQVEVERMQNEIDSNNKQIKELEAEKKGASSDAQVSYTTQIQALQTTIDKTKYDIKVKNIALEKIKNSISNAAVTADVAGTVKSVKTTQEMQENATDVIMTIVGSGDFRIKGKINEQNMGSMMQGEAVIISSRVDDTLKWNGTVSEVSNEPETEDSNNMYDDGTGGETSSSNYAFYIEPENIDGLMLGQHVLIEIDYGQSDAIEKSGIWLYADYIVDYDGDKPYVWAVDKKDRLEKRYIEIGQKDEINGDCEIVSGLSEDDYISYPADDYQEGMKTTTNYDDIDNSDDVIDDGGVVDDNGMVDDGGIVDDNGIIDDGGVVDDNGIVDGGGMIQGRDTDGADAGASDQVIIGGDADLAE